MTPKDRLNKAAWMISEMISDTVSQNVTRAVTSKQIQIDPAALNRLVALITASVTEGYNKANGSFMKTVTLALHDAASEATQPTPKKK